MHVELLLYRVLRITDMDNCLYPSSAESKTTTFLQKALQPPPFPLGSDKEEDRKPSHAMF
jgi:hypothetical protein